MARKWYVIRTFPRAEYLAAEELSREGFEVLLPAMKTPQPRRGHVDVPIFPGYLFLRCDPEWEGWPTFRPAHRVLGWVSFGGDIPSLPDEVLGGVMERLEELNKGHGFWRKFRPGERVRVMFGGLDTLAQVVQEAKSPQARARVLIEFMGGLVQAQVPWDHLRPLEPGSPAPGRVPRRTRGRGRWIRGYGSRVAANL